ncbi:MAG: hypothetical protein Q9183_005463 [Haloplaca sp. 2 TL-2023]
MSELDHGPPQLPTIRVTHFNANADRSISVKQFLRSLKQRPKDRTPRCKADSLQYQMSQSGLELQRQNDLLEESRAPALEDEASTDDLGLGQRLANHQKRSEPVQGELSRHRSLESGKVRKTYKAKRPRFTTAAMVADPQSPKKRRRCTFTNELPMIGIVEGVNFYDPTSDVAPDAPTDSIETCTENTVTSGLKPSANNHMPKRKPLSNAKSLFYNRSTVSMDPRDFRFPPKTPQRPRPRTWRPGSGFRKQKYAKDMKTGNLAGSIGQISTSSLSGKQRADSMNGGNLRSYKRQETPRAGGHRENSATDGKSHGVSSNSLDPSQQPPSIIKAHQSSAHHNTTACSIQKGHDLVLPEVCEGSHFCDGPPGFRYSESAVDRGLAAEKLKGLSHGKARSTQTQWRESSLSWPTRSDQYIGLGHSCMCPNGQERSRDAYSLLKHGYALDLTSTMPSRGSLETEVDSRQQRTMTFPCIPPFKKLVNDYEYDDRAASTLK